MNDFKHKYIVKLLGSGLTKEVARLSLRFVFEKPEKFEQRVEFSKSLRAEAESE